MVAEIPPSEMLLRHLQRTTVESLSRVVQTVLQRADDWLFDQAQRLGEGANPAEAAPRMEALAILRAQRATVERRFRERQEQLFERLRLKAVGTTGLTLSLVEADALEQQMAAEAVVEAVVRVHGPALGQLGEALRGVVGVVQLPAAEQPLSPQRLGHGFAEALRDAGLPASLSVVLMKYFERELLPSLPSLIERWVGHFRDAGVRLPALTPAVPAAARPEPPAMAVPTADPAGGPVAGDLRALEALVGLLRAQRQAALAGRGEAPASALASRGAMDTRRALAPTELLAMLATLQAEVPPGVAAVLEGTGDSLAHLLKRDLENSARRIGLSPERVRITPEEEDAVELVGMLFDVLFDERHFVPRGKQVVGRLVVPYVKAALLDRQLFLSRTHPARRFLNAVSEACDGNSGESPQEVDTLAKADALVSRLVAEFNEDIAIFELLEQELRGHLAQQAKRIELAERRAAEAQRGQERLETARQQAQQAVDTRTDSRDVPAALREFLTRAWTHHLSLVVLREGVGSPPWTQALSLADRLLGLLPGGAEAMRPLDAAMPVLRGELVAVLASSGVVGEAVDAVVDAIASGIAAQRAGDASRAADARAVMDLTPVLPPLPAMPRLRLVAGTEVPAPPAEAVERLRQLAVGQWIIIAGDDGRLAPVKLAWISPISQRLMFVNRRGVRILVASVEELATLQAQGKLELRSPGPAFEGSLQSVLGRLQQRRQA